ncbi:MAG TPA: DUF3027 domain-containing protein, partial [Pyrinomonadaceae bacterium]|nr:DUF3027 domain-containing protein [Pyrinomonadaceae bacterium]
QELFRETHLRWMGKLNRNMQSDLYQDEWGLEQCFNCKFFVPLTNPFGDDYGACRNASSPFDKTVMFEHDGCEFHLLETP